MTLQEGFKLRKTPVEDMPEVWAVLDEAFGDDEVWELMVRNCKKEEVLPWIINTLGPRWLLPDIETYSIIDESTGKIAGWTALQFPWKGCPTMTEELKILSQSQEIPPLLEGMCLEAVIEMFTILGFASTLGYDPETEFHRKGTMILPAYQRRGFGRQLTRHCNAIADKADAKTWVPARSKSVNMFKTEGFKEIATRESDLEKFGGASNDPSWFLLRDPQSS